MATGTVILPIQSAKIAGSYITAGAEIEGGSGPWKLLFDTSATESALWQFRLPTDYASGPVLQVAYAMTSAVDPADIEIECDIMAISDGDNPADIDVASFDTVNANAGVVVPTTAGNLDITSITLTNADSMAADDLVFIRLHRDHDGDDDAAGDCEVLAVSLEYTTT